MSKSQGVWGSEDFMKFVDYFGYLKARWMDESQYEDFSEYVEAAKKHLPKRFRFLSMVNRPFSLFFIEKATGIKRKLVANQRNVTLYNVTK